MATPQTGGPRTLNDDQTKLLKNLVELDHDAVEAYEAAIDRLDDADAKRNLTEFKADHERHIRDLSAILSGAGEKAPKKGDIKRFLTKGKVIIGDIAGDKGVLSAMSSNEKTTNAKYDEALSSPVFQAEAEIRRVLTRNRDDERRHKAWIDAKLDQLG